MPAAGERLRAECANSPAGLGRVSGKAAVPASRGTRRPSGSMRPLCGSDRCSAAAAAEGRAPLSLTPGLPTVPGSPHCMLGGAVLTASSLIWCPSTFCLSVLVWEASPNILVGHKPPPDPRSRLPTPALPSAQTHRSPRSPIRAPRDAEAPCPRGSAASQERPRCPFVRGFEGCSWIPPRQQAQPPRRARPPLPAAAGTQTGPTAARDSWRDRVGGRFSTAGSRAGCIRPCSDCSLAPRVASSPRSVGLESS